MKPLMISPGGAARTAAPETAIVMIKSQSAALQDLIAQMQALQAKQQEETLRLRRRLEWLESRRREFFEIMAANASDLENRRKLAETERQTDEMQKLLAQSDAEIKAAMAEIRQKILALRNEELTRLEEEARIARERKERIKNRLLPNALSRVGALQEEEAKLNHRTEELARRIRELHVLDPSIISQSQVA